MSAAGRRALRLALALLRQDGCQRHGLPERCRHVRLLRHWELCFQPCTAAGKDDIIRILQ